MARQFDNTEKLTNLYYAIGYYRKRKGLSQEQLAEDWASAASIWPLSKRQT